MLLEEAVTAQPSSQSGDDSSNVSTPVRVDVGDQPADILRFALDAFDRGGVALATLVEIRGGAARALGSHVAIAADGRFCGYVSGGCVEAAVASEALVAIAEGADRNVTYGDGSPFFDIVLPCGGGITVAIHVLRDAEPLRRILDQVAGRVPAALRYSPETQSLELSDCPQRTCWQGAEFVTVYRPVTRVIICGMSIEAEAVARLAKTSRWDVVLPNGFEGDLASMIDGFTAVVLLHHDLDAEERVLDAATASSAFYVGALGSARTHLQRSDRMQKRGFSRQDIDRIKAPIGIFGPTRDATALALSVMADIAASRLAAYG
ncbi:xanthine dehydrogenase accessory factor [Neorhizobium huautlense]|uniref:Xanthine dehydrogenase accessory factor n=1 Tax=Neorhizobium huautlense TaxID=67774 RepID=A0ABT9PRC0_9HYPH|nr:XdhC family protein [Neorhizobium huautlense]MDP9837017.1 xanthine dehydrogenase accessory factor [Neorhizobium huautlense]